jgi:hypothetical protein
VRPAQRVTPVAADIATHEGQRAVLAACPEPGILIGGGLYRSTL